MEVYGNNQEFYDNGVYSQNGTIENSTIGGLGMLISGPDTTVTSVYISESDPWDPSDTEKDINNNSYGGIWVRPGASYLDFENIHIDGNGGWGVYLDTVNTATFSSGVCMSANTSGNITAPNSSSVTYPTSYNSCS